MSALVEEVRLKRTMPTPKRARAIRIAAGVSQIRLAEELGVAPVTVSRWELGERRPRGEMAVRYAEILAALREELASP